jgi:CheY-like chemotaxis protein
MDKVDLLFVEDSANDAHFVQRILKKENLTEDYRWLKNGVEVIDYFFGGEENPIPKFIVLDIKMPKINGFEVLERLKAETRTKNIPIIVYSSSMVKSDIKKAYALGANSYISKPPRYQEMKELFILLFSYWINFNKNINYD